MWNEVCDDHFLKRRLSKYSGIERYKKEDESWKQFFSRFAFYTSLMQKSYEFVHLSGDFERQYDLLTKYKGNDLLFEAAKNGELELVKYTQKNGINIHTESERAFKNAIENGHLEIVKWLVVCGASVNLFRGAPLRIAAEYGHLEIFKFLETVGAHINYEKALMFAHAFGHLQVEEYLTSKL